MINFIKNIFKRKKSWHSDYTTITRQLTQEECDFFEAHRGCKISIEGKASNMRDSYKIRDALLKKIQQKAITQENAEKSKSCMSKPLLRNIFIPCRTLQHNIIDNEFHKPLSYSALKETLEAIKENKDK